MSTFVPGPAVQGGGAWLRAAAQYLRGNPSRNLDELTTQTCTHTFLMHTLIFSIYIYICRVYLKYFIWYYIYIFKNQLFMLICLCGWYELFLYCYYKESNSKHYFFRLQSPLTNKSVYNIHGVINHVYVIYIFILQAHKIIHFSNIMSKSMT